ncbi:hypothetical protein RvY_15856 [Ramazzottius varieornatus]|uniref:Peptidase M12B domain-containing protein n=1 Tax=Ramazzottius varieornatus TaxID=947166 RepID=A0A1D1W0W9_RAMVA|nr:hypothetical protein RvY_15856 [Ramazzottius varieornatus]
MHLVQRITMSFYIFSLPIASFGGLLSDRLRTFDILKPQDVGHKIVKRGTTPSSNQYNHIQDTRFSALGKEFRLTLTPKTGLLSSDLEVIVQGADGVSKSVAIDKQSFYSGHVFGEKESEVNLHIHDRQMTGSVRTGAETFYFEPADLHLPVENTATLVYRKSDIITTPLSAESNHSVCGYTEPDQEALLGESEVDPAEPLLHRKTRDIPTFAPTHTRCGLRVVADYRFFNSVGGKSAKRTITYLINVIDRVNAIYNATNWNEGHEKDPLLGYGFVIQAINVLTEPTVVKEGGAHYNDRVTGRTSKEILDLFSRDSDHAKYCLAHLFTDQTLESAVLGLAYVGNGRPGSAGGICSVPYHKDGRSLHLNSGLTTARNNYDQIVITREMELVTAHELGHNWGSQHDPETRECTPESRVGGRFLMYMYSVSGLESNNKFFSPCSRRSVRDVIINKAASCFYRPEKSLCGNFLVEEGEECDAGYIGAEDKDTCCDQRCRLRTGAKCSDKNSVCCANCQMQAAGTRCSDGSSQLCEGASFCNGLSANCPKAPPVPDGTPCVDEGMCRSGHCMSFCETRGLKSCVCDNITESCFYCCRREGDPCQPFSFSGKHKPVPNGRPCIQGHCSTGVCEQTIRDFSARVWTVIERIDFSNFAAFLKNNLVGVVIILSLIVWIPASLMIHKMDKEFEQENSEVMDNLRRSISSQHQHNVNIRSATRAQTTPLLSGDRKYVRHAANGAGRKSPLLADIVMANLKQTNGVHRATSANHTSNTHRVVASNGVQETAT